MYVGSMAHLTMQLAANWFFPVALLLFAAVWSLSKTAGALSQADWPQLEAALIADALLTLPALYWLCFRKRHGKGKMFLGVIAVICSSLWLAGLIVPPAEQDLLQRAAWLRYFGLAVIFLIEARIAVLAFRAIWRPETKVADLEAHGVPPIMAKLMLLEARFWRWVFSAFRK